MKQKGNVRYIQKTLFGENIYSPMKIKMVEDKN